MGQQTGPVQRRLVPRTPRRANGRTLAIDAYARLLATPWHRMILLFVSLYLGANLTFASLYYLLGDVVENTRAGRFSDLFFFSVQTMATIGYGKMTPVGLAANLLVTIEAFFGLAFFAVATGLVFVRFSLPTARVLFSDVAVVCSFDGQPHLMARLANERGNRIVNARVQMQVLLNVKTADGHRMRRFFDMTLARERVPLMQLTWTVMHRIDAGSPLHGLSIEDLAARQAEIIVSLTGIDETLSQTIHSRTSYLAGDLRWDEMFVDILKNDGDGGQQIDYGLFHNTRPHPPARENMPDGAKP